MKWINVEIVSKSCGIRKNNEPMFKRHKIMEVEDIEEEIVNDPKFQKDLENFVLTWRKKVSRFIKLRESGVID